MPDGFWRKRVSRRRLLAGAASAALVGGGASLLLPRRLPASGSAGGVPVTAEDFWHTPAELAKGELSALRWDSLDGQPGLRAAAAGWEGTYTSPVVKTRIPSTHVGLHWRSDGPQAADIRFELRTSADGSRWSPWQPTWIDCGPSENPRAETFASLVWVENARFIQYRAHLQSEPQDSPLLRYVVVTALSAEPPSADLKAAKKSRTRTPTPTRTSTPAAEAEYDELVPPFDKDYMLTREEWGAPESYRFDQWGREAWPRMYVPTKKIVVHHTATLTNSNTQDPNYPYPSYNYDQAVQDVRAIYYYHAITRGWGDIGYNLLIDRFGRVYEGRRGRDNGPDGGREIISPDVVAGHVYNVNEGSAGVSLVGNYDVNALGSTEENNMIKALLDFLTWSCRRHYVSPTGISDFLMVNWGWVKNMPNVCGHCDCGATACPGRYVYWRLPEWRQKVEERISDSAPDGPSVRIAQYPTAEEIADGRASFSWKAGGSAAALFAYYLEGWLPNLDTDEVYYITGFTDDKRPEWSAFTANTSASFTLPQPGRYTLHVRAKSENPGDEGPYEENYTFTSASERTTHTIGVPGVTKN